MSTSSDEDSRGKEKRSSHRSRKRKQRSVTTATLRKQEQDDNEENEDEKSPVKSDRGQTAPTSPPESPSASVEEKNSENKFFNFSRLKETVEKVRGKSLRNVITLSESENEIGRKDSEIQLAPVPSSSAGTGTGTDSETGSFKTTSSALLANNSSHIRSDVGEGNFWNVLATGQPKIKTQNEKDEFELLLYVPSNDPVPLELKLPENVNPRNPEEEGIFVGQTVKISEANQNRLEQRIFMEGSLGWFGQDGKLASFPDPYRPEPLKLLPSEQFGNEVMESLKFVPAKKDAYQRIVQLDSKNNYEIVVDIGSLCFTHHSLFSKENVLASRLETFLQGYSHRQESQVTERAENKLKSLRETLNHAKDVERELLTKIDEGTEVTAKPEEKIQLFQCRSRMRRYRYEMQATRLERDQSRWDDRESLVIALDTWKDLKALRENQGYSNTALKVNILILEEDFNLARENYAIEMEEEFKDLREEFEANYETEISKYRRNLKDWMELNREGKGESRRSHVRAEKPYKKKAGSKSKGRGDNSSSSSSSDESDGESHVKSEDSVYSLTDKPVPPVKFDSLRTRDDISNRFHQLKRMPGEPKIVLELVKTSLITTTNNIPEGLTREIQRRRATLKAKIEIRLIFNGREIYRSKSKQMTPDFTAFFGITVPINVKEWPESLIIQMWEGAKLLKSQISEIVLPLPNSKTSIERCHMQKMEFSSEEVVRTNNTGVGCGILFEILENEFSGLFTSGYATVRIGWSVDKSGNILCPVGFDKRYEKENYENTVTGKQLFQSGNVQKWSEHEKIDPNDPQNARWIDIAAKKLARPQGTKKLIHYDSGTDFPLDGQMVEFDFCTMESIENNLRFRLLQLRDEKVPEFRGLRMIPAFDSSISPDIFDEYERREKEESNKKLGALTRTDKKRHALIESSAFESNRLEKIREVRLAVLQLFENSLKQITFEDLVIEEQIPDIGTLGLNLMTIFQPKRPLRPIRKERKRIQGTALIDTKISLIVNIVRAFNLPIRRDTEIVGLMTTESVTGISLQKKRGGTSANNATLKPFAEIWFQRNVCRTTTALGSNPTWNQELQLTLKVLNDDYSSANLSKMDDLVYILVYDEIAVDLLEDDRRRDTDIHQRLQKRWLGSLTIPFSTLYTNGRIEGTFKLNSPSLLLGYEQQGMATHFGTNVASKTTSVPTSLNLTKGAANAPISNQKNAFITLFVTLQPTVSSGSTSKEEGATGETAEMISHVKNWQNSVRHKYPDRIVKPFVMSPDGDTVLCTRYLKPIEPPLSLIRQDVKLIKTMEELAHYVSLFPTVRDSTLGISDYSLWFTSDAFVMTPGGGIEDHAVLLACYFMHLEVPCWIVQGNAIPNGLTTFVATSFKYLNDENAVTKALRNTTLFWNPCSAEYYTSTDSFCPLHKVWTVIGRLNIWANTSDFERPHQLDWDIEKSKQWTPLFSKSIPENKLPSLQSGLIKYKAPDQIQAKSLAQRIERFLKESFMKWRKASNTNWNRSCSSILRRLLPKLEERMFMTIAPPETGNEESNTTFLSESVTNLQDEHLIELKEIVSSYKMTGFPLQQPYVNFDSLAEVLFATGVHTIDAPFTEFALATYAKAYPASVYSVWIYIASLHRDR